MTDQHLLRWMKPRIWWIGVLAERGTGRRITVWNTVAPSSSGPRRSRRGSFPTGELLNTEANAFTFLGAVCFFGARLLLRPQAAAG